MVLVVLTCLWLIALTTLIHYEVLNNLNVRLLTGIEALNGLVLIAWSASYAYVAMQQFWVQEKTTA